MAHARGVRTPFRLRSQQVAMPRTEVYRRFTLGLKRFYEDEETAIFIRRWTHMLNLRTREWCVVTDRPHWSALRRPGGIVSPMAWNWFVRQAGRRRAWLEWIEDFLGWRPIGRMLDRRWRPPEGYNPAFHEGAELVARGECDLKATTIRAPEEYSDG